MATKSKTPAKKAVKELDIRDGTYLTFREEGVQEVAHIRIYNTNEDGTIDLELDLDYSYENGSIRDFQDIKSMKDLFYQMKDSKATDIQIITKVQADKLVKQLHAAKFDTGDFTAVPYKTDKEEGYIFGCGKVKLTTKEISDYLSIRKKMITPDLSKDKAYHNFKVVNTFLQDEDSKVEDDVVLELCKRFKI